LDATWRLRPEEPAFRERVLVTTPGPDGTFANEWTPRRPIPDDDPWFETAWAAFRNGSIYG
jgi:hypothetical protein